MSTNETTWIVSFIPSVNGDRIIGLGRIMLYVKTSSNKYNLIVDIRGVKSVNVVFHEWYLQLLSIGINSEINDDSNLIIHTNNICALGLDTKIDGLNWGGGVHFSIERIASSS